MNEQFVWIKMEFMRNFLNYRYMIFGIVFLSLILGIFIAFIFADEVNFIKNKYYDDYLFFITVGCAFFGILKGIFDIYRDGELLHKFLRSGLELKYYFISKLLIVMIIAILQVFLLNIPGFFIFHMHNAHVILMCFNILISFLVYLASYSLALVFSSVIKNDILACLWVAGLLLPQIILGGQIPFKDMHNIVFSGSQALYSDAKLNKDRTPPVTFFFAIPLGYEAMLNVNRKIPIYIEKLYFERYGVEMDLANTEISGSAPTSTAYEFNTIDKSIFGVRVLTYKVNSIILIFWYVFFGIISYFVYKNLNKPKFIIKG